MAYRGNNAASIMDALRRFVETRGSIYQDFAHSGFYVMCAKHPGVDIPVALCDEDILTAIHDAFDSCLGCIEDAQHQLMWENTRFPEDAEL